jgi:alpha-beta hydrolase superfamily lysophospholipase
MENSPDTTDFWTAPDGSRLGRLRWLPDGTRRARVVALHGLSCRVEDFAPLGEMLRGRGIALEAWNLRGQGLDPVSGRRGAWLDVDGMLADLAAFAGEPDSDIPLFLCGESMGALLALQAMTREPWRSRVAGLLLFVPVVALAQKNPKWTKSLLRHVSLLVPGLRLEPSWFVHGSASAPPLTRIPEYQAEFETAPHRLGAVTLGFLAQMGELIEAAMPAAPQIEVPVALFSAGHDAFIKTEQTGEFFDLLASRDKTHFHYPESYHHLLFDLDADQVLAAAASWIEARLSTPRT